MSYDPSSAIAMGLFVPYEIFRRELVTTKEVRGCIHTEKHSSFCPECGSPMWQIIEDTDVLRVTIDTEKFEGFNVSAIHSHGCTQGVILSTEKKRVCGGYKQSHFSQLELDTEKVQSLRNQLKEKFEPLGFWEEENFGVFSFLY